MKNLKLKINPILFENIKYIIAENDDEKMMLATQVFNMLISANPESVSLAKYYMEQDYFQEYIPYLNKIGEETFSELVKLTKMSWIKIIRQNNIDLSNKLLKKFPKGLDKLINLEFLDISNNQLKEIPEGIGNLINLKVLYLEDNMIKQIPESIKNLTNMNTFYLMANHLSKSEEIKIKNLLPNCRIFFNRYE